MVTPFPDFLVLPEAISWLVADVRHVQAEADDGDTVLRWFADCVTAVRTVIGNHLLSAHLAQ
jgi:hypothetical protein